ncbi:DUF58 domain-containing protein [Evansella sp. AB-rgal1]|uniref:DUF58 domain-containing protein n=1 Tax=Evansella sp. AB-rgal1 TaxID=3242696 RepID=UPI00359D1E41
MKHWKKQTNFSKTYYSLGYFLPFLALFAFILNEYMLFSLAVFILFVLVLNNYYLKYAINHIAISEEKIVKRIFPEDKIRFTIPFENRGSIPIFQVKAKFFLYFTDESVRVIESEDSTNYYSNFEHPFTLPKLTKRNIGMNLEAVKRGTAELRTIEVDVYDLFKFIHIRLRYEGPFQGEVIVYPTPVRVKGLEKIIQLEKGDHPQPFSMYEDVMMIMGNRDYTSSDPFNRINWKASARTDTLQTKLFEKVTVSHWTLVLNIRSDHNFAPTIPNLEKVLSQVTYACQLATKYQVSFEMYINLRVPGSSVGFHLPMNTTNNHLIKALEILARIRKSNITIPAEHMLNVVVKNLAHQNHPFILHFGPIDEEQSRLYERVKRVGGSVGIINTEEEDESSLHQVGGDR